MASGSSERGTERGSAAWPSLPPRLHVVTDSAVLADAAFLERAADVLEAGASGVALHVRGPATPGRELHACTAALLPVAKAAGAWLIVNDRVDVALAVGDVGVHLGERSLPLAETRALAGPGRTIGVSAHDAAGAERAATDGANFVFVGNVFDTPSHPEREGMGTDELGRICRRVPGLPVMAIGGIRPEHVAALITAGAHGVAVLGGVWNRPGAGMAARAYLEALEAVEDVQSEET